VAADGFLSNLTMPVGLNIGLTTKTGFMNVRRIAEIKIIIILLSIIGHLYCTRPHCHRTTKKPGQKICHGELKAINWI